MSEEDFEFGDKLPDRDDEIAPERWERVREEVNFIALAEELLTKSKVWHREGNAIRCPFHGSDSTPSFYLYDHTNSGYCFGCPPPKQNQTYDSINFVAKFFDINKVEALRWIEKHYKLPYIAGTPSPDYEEDEEDEEYTLTVEDLAPHYLRVAPTLIESVDDAKALLKKYFLAVREEDPLFLARVLGRRRLDSIIETGRKHEGSGR